MCNEPKPLSFGDTPASAVTPSNRAPEAVRVPGALSFSDDTPAATPPRTRTAPIRAERAPDKVGQLNFGPEPVRGAASVPPVSPGVPVRAVAPLRMDSAPVEPSAPVGPRPVFGGKSHPLETTARAKAAALGGPVYLEHQERVDRNIARLLPFTREKVETWASNALDDGRAVTTACANHSARFNALHSAQRLDEVLKANEPATGMLARMKRSFTMSRTEQEAVITQVRSQLMQTLEDVRKAQPEAKAVGQRLIGQLLALRAVAEASGRPDDSTFELMLDQRLRLLQAAATQLQMLPAQLKLVEDTASMQFAQCEQLLTVTLSAQAFSRNLAGSPR